MCRALVASFIFPYIVQAADNDVLKAKVASLESDKAASFAEVNMLRAELAASSLKACPHLYL